MSNSTPDQNKKKDLGKPPMHLLSPIANAALAYVLGGGAIKYTRGGWLSGMEWSRVIDAAERHWDAYRAGEDLDPETGLPHIDHLQACAHMLSHYYHARPEDSVDDRLTIPEFRPIMDNLIESANKALSEFRRKLGLE